MARKQFSWLGLGMVTVLAVSTVVQFLAMLLVAWIYPQGGEPGWLLWVYTFAPMYLVAIPLGILVMKKAPATPVEERSIRSRDLIATTVICFFLMYLGNIIGTIIIDLTGALVGSTPENPLDTYVENGYVWLRILVMVVLAPLIEEYLFRKQLIDRMHAYGGKVAVVTSALIFGLAHGNLSQFFYAFALGLVFGNLYLKTGRLRYSATLHMLINFMGGYVAPTLLEKVDMEALEQVDVTNTQAVMGQLRTIMPLMLYSLILLGLVIAGIVMFCTRCRKTTFEPEPNELQGSQRFTSVFLNVGMLLFIVLSLVLIVLTFIP